jgi:predicted nucleic acid-binding Zn ribbon protein
MNRKGALFMPKKDPHSNSFTPIGQVLDTIMDRFRTDSQGGISHLIRMWDKVIGPPISENARPFAVKGSLLLVHVSSSAWMHQLHFLKAELLDRLNRSLHDARIEEIAFKIGPLHHSRDRNDGRK